MRFPVSLTYTGTNETLEIQDHKLVFQLADVLNEMNKGKDPKLQVNFIPWIQSNPKYVTLGLTKESGLISRYLAHTCTPEVFESRTALSLDEANTLLSSPTPHRVFLQSNLPRSKKPLKKRSSTLSITPTSTSCRRRTSSRLTSRLWVGDQKERRSRVTDIHVLLRTSEEGLHSFSETQFLRSQGLGWNETSAVGGTGEWRDACHRS